MELIWPPAKEPRWLALILIVYIVATIVGSALYGAEAWLRNLEVFSVFARTLSRFSLLALRPVVAEVCATAPGQERRARLRLYGAVLRSAPGLPDGGAA